MKFISKTYILLAIIIGTAGFNLFLLYMIQQEGTIESNSIIHANDIKVKVSDVASYASSISAGNEEDRDSLQDEVNEIDLVFDALRKGGSINGQPVLGVPNNIQPQFDTSYNIWRIYKQSAEIIQVESVFDPTVRESLNYVLQKNGELVILTQDVVDEFSSLDRDYRRHKEISQELTTLVQEISADALLISIGEGEGAQESIQKNRLLFEVGLRKLLQIPLDDLDLRGLMIDEQEILLEIPRENTSALKQLDPLWESIGLRIEIIESNSLFSKNFGTALNILNKERVTLSSSLDLLLLLWNDYVDQKTTQSQRIIQGLTGVDISVFILVFIIIRKSLNPLAKVTTALGRVKEGVYGEKIQVTSNDEFGVLVDTFNTMSETILQKTEEAKATDKAKDEFLAMITHELKTPLVPIQGYVDMMLQGHLGDLNDKQKDRLNIIKQNSGALLKLINDILDVQKLELNELKMTMDKQSIEKTILDSIESQMPKVQLNNISINYRETNDVLINHDKVRIIQVLSNLIDNSINAIKTDEGKIDITMVDLPDEIKIAVNDNGVGIPEDSLKTIFKKFYQIDSSLTRETKGTGLGLSICKGIIEAHGGKLWAENNPHEGVSIFFTIPKIAPKVQ